MNGAYEKQCGVKAHVAGDDFYTPKKAPTKILVCDYDMEVMKEIESVLRTGYADKVGQVKSKPFFFEMNNKECSKGNAVKALARRTASSHRRSWLSAMAIMMLRCSVWQVFFCGSECFSFCQGSGKGTDGFQ